MKYFVALFFIAILIGCQQYSKEEQRQIDTIKERVTANPAAANEDFDQITPLEFAILNQYADLADWLVEHGAGVNYLDPREQMPLHYAAVVDREPKLPMSRFLLKHGADVNARRRGYETPLHIAVQLGRGEMAKLLVEHGADINIGDQFGRTAVHQASFPQGYPAILTLLLSKGGRINQPDNYGLTPLHLAAIGRNPEVVRVLIEHGANLNAKNGSGFTPLHQAAQAGNAQIAELLISHGADLNAADTDGHTPLWIALNRPAVTASQSYSGPVDTSAVAEKLRKHGGTD